MRWVLFGATVVLAALVVVASPLGRILDPVVDPDGKPLSLALERRCSEKLPVDPWRRSFAERLEHWLKAVRGSSGAPRGGEGDTRAAESLRLTGGAARATLEAFYLLEATQPASPPGRPVGVEDVRVHFCPGPQPLWEIRWQEGSGPTEPERWLALLAIEELDVSAETHLAHPEGFVVTDFDWGRDPTDPGAAAP